MMNNKKHKLNRWAYGFAVLPLILGCVLTMMVVYLTFPNIPGALEERVNIDDLSQVIVPGSADISFAKPGAYTDYYEYRSLVDGVRYETGKQPPALECSLASKATGARINAVPDFVESNIFKTQAQERIGVLIMSITIDDPGSYSFACNYRDGSTQPEIVVSVGPNFVWESFNVFAKAGGSILSGLAVLTFAMLASIIVLLFVIVKRTQSKIWRAA